MAIVPESHFGLTGAPPEANNPRLDHIVARLTEWYTKAVRQRATLYRWWLYRGPGFRSYRKRVRAERDILPPGFTAIDAHFDEFDPESSLGGLPIVVDSVYKTDQ